MFKVFLRKVKKMSVQNQIVSACVLFTFLSMLVIGFLLSFILYTESLDNTYNEMTVYVEKTRDSMDQMLELITTTAHSVAATDTIVLWVDDPESLYKTNSGYYKSINNLEDEIKHILGYSSAWRSDLISYISVFVNGELISYTYSKQLSEKQIIQGSQQAYKKLIPTQGTELLPENKEGLIYYGLTLKSDFTSHESLVVLIATDKQAFKKHYEASFIPEGAMSALVDGESKIYSSNLELDKREEVIGSILDRLQVDQITQVKIEDKKYAAIAKVLPEAKFNFVYLVPHQQVLTKAYEKFPLFISIALLLIFFISVAGLLMSRKITMFLRDLTISLRGVRDGDYDVKMPHYNNNSVDEISDVFNSMTAEMKELIQKTYESKIMLKDMEFKFLQQQMNPHFLFNILLVIQIKAKMSSDETVYQMLTSLSGLLRASLYSDKNTYTTLEQELSYIEFYLYLQKQRFTNRLHYDIQVDEELKGMQVPRLTIEPIAENAVVHGLEGHEQKVHISIKAYRQQGDLVIVVEDDGSGFDQKDFTLEDTGIREGNSRESIGLNNINSRLKRLYGESYGLEIESRPNRGTKVLVRVKTDMVKAHGGN